MGRERILIVEGTDDEHTVKHICGAHGIPELNFKGQGGYDSALKTFLVQVKSEAGKQECDVSIGLIVDADSDVRERWESIKRHLLNLGYRDFPNEPLPPAEGSIIEYGDLPRVGIWIMPNNQQPGILEHFLEMCIGTDDVLIRYARECVGNIEPRLRLFSEIREQKAVLHTWLAWQEDPGRPYGQAIKNNSINARSEQATNFAAWLSSLYSEDSNEAK